MKTVFFLRGLLVAGALIALALTSRAQVVELRATINAAQEVPTNGSLAAGAAIMLYDVTANTFDLIVTINGMTNTATASHIHEGAPGVSGPVVTGLGAEAVYTRTGNTLTATFRGVTHLGDKLKLLQNGAYFNIHTAQFPGGEIRGQLIARPKRLVANLDVAQEQAAFPAVNLAGANLSDFGGAVMSYDPGTNRVSLRVSVFNFRNAMSNSHYHEGAPGVSGGVVLALGTSPTAGGYTNANGYIAGSFDLPYTGDPIKLLTGGAYLNFHSTTFGNGELRGQVRATDEIPSSRMINVSTRGFVGTDVQQLIQGLSVIGPDPVRILISAKGPSLTAFGVTGVLADPVLSLYDSAGRQIAQNDNIGATAGTELANIPGAPSNAAESALLVVLSPGNYTAVVSGVGGTTGVALLEATDLRIIGLVPSTTAPVITDVRGPAVVVKPDTERFRETVKAALELCGAPAPALTLNTR